VYGRELRKAAYPAEIGFVEELINSMRGTPPMKQDNVVAFETPQENEDPLTELLRNGAKRLIEQAVEAELGELLSSYEGRTDDQGRAAVVRNGYLPERYLQPGEPRVAGLSVRYTF